MKAKKILIYYFSGTGNTLLAVKEMAKTFREAGREVSLRRLEKSDPARVDLSGLLGLAFPVAVQSTYPFIWEFLEKLPEGRGAGVFMVDTLAAFSGGIVGPLGKMLRKKGYRTIGAKEIRMPSNFYPRRLDPEKNARKRERGLKKAREYARALLSGEARWGRVPFLSDLVKILSRNRHPWKYMSRLGRGFTVDEERCSRCRSCVELCPVGNIRMEDYPIFADRCQQCMRCISFCPRNAISNPAKHSLIYRAVSLAEMPGGG
jgi:ferredoxin